MLANKVIEFLASRLCLSLGISKYESCFPLNSNAVSFTPTKNKKINFNIFLKQVKVKVKLRFLAPSAGIAEIEQT